MSDWAAWLVDRAPSKKREWTRAAYSAPDCQKRIGRRRASFARRACRTLDSADFADFVVAAAYWRRRMRQIDLILADSETYAIESQMELY